MRRRDPTKPRYKWVTMQRSEAKPPSEALIQDWMDHSKADRETVLKAMAKEIETVQFWLNDIYQVETRPMSHNMLHINIRRRDGAAILRDWRHFQQIKNDIVGPECEAIELYPAESRLVDTSNKYHLVACLDPTFRFPIDLFNERDVNYESGRTPATRQRPL